MTLSPLGPAFGATVRSLHAVAAYVVAPARHRSTGRIGLAPTATGFATPPLPDGSVVAVDGAELVRDPGGRAPLTSLRAAADFLGIDLDPRPPIGADLPPFRPDAPLEVDADASSAVGSWWVFGAAALEELRNGADAEVGPAQLWPEHFDLGAVAVLPDGSRVNLGFSPGDEHRPNPYAYVGPQDPDRRRGGWWNAPFGAARAYDELVAMPDAAADVLTFLRRGLTEALRTRVRS